MIGLLTFHRANNYGAVLQAYALQHAIEDCGKDCEYLDIVFNKSIKNKENLSNTYLNKITSITKLNAKFKNRIRGSKFNKFREKYIKISEEISGNDIQVKDSDKYDKYIVGSDQVWNFAITNSTKSFLLHFVDTNKQKNSYASSFGIDKLTNAQSRIFSRYLSEFDNISVREEQGKRIISEITNKEVNICLDPTLLLNEEAWSMVWKRPRKKKYVLLYAMADSDGLINTAKKIARLKNIPIFSIGLKRKIKGIKNIETASPEQWLGLIKYADTVITNSFHGTVFSINFKKNFFVEYLPDGWTVNSRLEDAVNKFGLHNVLISKQLNINNKPDYDYIHLILEKEKEYSKNYLKNIICN